MHMRRAEIAYEYGEIDISWMELFLWAEAISKEHSDPWLKVWHQVAQGISP